MIESSFGPQRKASSGKWEVTARAESHRQERSEGEGNIVLVQSGGTNTDGVSTVVQLSFQLQAHLQRPVWLAAHEAVATFTLWHL